MTKSTWKPIETAPKRDHVSILLYNECWEMTFGGIQIAWWDGEGWVFASEMNLEPEDDIDFEPTHWMPLPAPPLPIGEEGNKS